jgi:hypothetical protein
MHNLIKNNQRQIYKSKIAITTASILTGERCLSSLVCKRQFFKKDLWSANVKCGRITGKLSRQLYLNNKRNGTNP